MERVYFTEWEGEKIIVNMKKNITTVSAIALFITLMASCEEEKGFGIDTNGFLEGTTWVQGNQWISFSKHGVTLSDTVHFSLMSYGTVDLRAGTYYSYFTGTSVRIDDNKRGVNFKLNGVFLEHRDTGYWSNAYFVPAPGTVFINGTQRFKDNFVAEETNGGLTITRYVGNDRALTIPAEIGGVPVVAIGGGLGIGTVGWQPGIISPFTTNQWNDRFLQLRSIVIPANVKIIRAGVFRSDNLFIGGDYLSDGITIGADVAIMGRNTVASWDQNWGALDVEHIGESNFVGYESQRTGFWQDMGFVQFYNENGRQAGKYTYTASYSGMPNYRWTFTWTLEPH